MDKAKTLYDYDQAEQNAMPYGELRALRREEFDRRMAKLVGPPATALIDWAFRMAARFGDRVGMLPVAIGGELHLYKVDWITALMIVRYGEEPSKWPDAFTEKDERRALEWEQGAKPAYAVHIGEA